MADPGATSPTSVEDPAELFTVAPERFIAARDALVRRLRSAGDKAEAGRVAKMRRPPLTVWALNQLARRDPTVIGELLDAGSQLRVATERALGGDATSLREARRREQIALDQVVAQAVSDLAQAGYAANDTLRQRMAATLQAAVVDESVAELLQSGTLTSDHDAPGFGMDALAGFELPAPPVEAAGASGGSMADQAARNEDVAGGEAAVREAAVREAVVREAAVREAAVREAAVREAAVLALVAEAEARAAEADRLEAEADRLEDQARLARGQADEARGRAAAAAASASAAQAAASGR